MTDNKKFEETGRANRTGEMTSNEEAGMRDSAKRAAGQRADRFGLKWGRTPLGWVVAAEKDIFSMAGGVFSAPFSTLHSH